MDLLDGYATANVYAVAESANDPVGASMLKFVPSVAVNRRLVAVLVLVFFALSISVYFVFGLKRSNSVFPPLAGVCQFCADLAGI